MNLYKKLAKFLGYELVNRGGNPSLAFHMMDLLDLRKIDMVIDVGGNKGQFAKSLREQGYQGIIHSFEPVKATFDILTLSSEGDGNWFVHNTAMGDVVGEATINVTHSSDFASLLEPSEYGSKRFKNNTTVYTEVIKINTIDHFLKHQIDNFEQHRIFLKTDTQGHDPKVVAGAKLSMPWIHCLLTEVSFIPIYDGMEHYLDVLKTFESYGFSATGFYPITRDKESLSLIEMDCMMINKNNA
jgi:FkbM family methyltransferase